MSRTSKGVDRGRYAIKHHDLTAVALVPNAASSGGSGTHKAAVASLEHRAAMLEERCAELPQARRRGHCAHETLKVCRACRISMA